MKVTAPDGREWTVRRRWWPKPPRFKPGRRVKLSGDVADGVFSGFGTGSLTGLLIGIALIILITTAGWLLLPALLFLLQALLLVVVLPGYVVLRLVFHQPWVVEATTGGPLPQRRAWAVRGLRTSGVVVRMVAGSLAAGAEPDPAGARPLRLE